MNQAIDQIAQIAECCSREKVVYGLEIEANLLGNTGYAMAQLFEGGHSPAMVTIFDGGNLSSQNLGPEQCFAEFKAMRASVGWMHVKDYRIDPSLKWEGFVDEERLKTSSRVTKETVVMK